MHVHKSVSDRVGWGVVSGLGGVRGCGVGEDNRSIGTRRLVQLTTATIRVGHGTGLWMMHTRRESVESPTRRAPSQKRLQYEGALTNVLNAAMVRRRALRPWGLCPGRALFFSKKWIRPNFVGAATRWSTTLPPTTSAWGRTPVCVPSFSPRFHGGSNGATRGRGRRRVAELCPDIWARVRSVGCSALDGGAGISAAAAAGAAADR